MVAPHGHVVTLTLTRDHIATTVARVVEAQGDKPDGWAAGLEVATQLGFGPASAPDEPPAIPSTLPAPGLDYGVWLDDPPRLTLQAWYLDRLRELPLGHVAVMADGPAPGLSDARWDEVALAELAMALRDVRRTLTVWTAAHDDAARELHERLPAMAHALGADAVEADAEPIGEWAASKVRGYGGLDEAAEDVAAAMLAPGVGVEVTVFPGALRHARRLLEALVDQAGPGQAVRLLVQAYAVRHRSRQVVPWSGALGPLRLPGESIEAARDTLPDRVEVCYGRAVYDTAWPAGRDSLAPGTWAALDAGARVIRDWSAKHLCRLGDHELSRARVLRVHEAALEMLAA